MFELWLKSGNAVGSNIKLCYPIRGHPSRSAAISKVNGGSSCSDHGSNALTDMKHNTIWLKFQGLPFIRSH